MSHRVAQAVFRCQALFLGAMLAVSGCGRGATSSSPVTVQAIGREFEWWFRYPGPDAVLGRKDDVETKRELVLPPRVEAQLLLTSDDYVYSMTLPGYAAKEIAVPEMTHEIAFRTGDEESFDLPVDPLCAVRLWHNDVMGRVTIESRDDFERLFGRS
jgi:heme/copper-type cytochrome/quinol oxidase subunit 2